jgi:hypothetical protein
MKKPDRNDPCPCGSGKKYKKCCYLKALPAAGEENSLRSELVRKVIAFSLEQFPEAIDVAHELFWLNFDPEAALEGESLQAAETSFWEWFIHDFQIENEGHATPIELYEKGGMALDPERIGMLERMRKTALCLYEVADVFPEEGLLLNDLFRGGQITVREKLGTRGLRKWDIIAARLISVDGVSVISGGMHPYPRSAKSELLATFEKMYGKYRKHEPEASRTDFLKLFGHYFNRFWCGLVKTPFQPKLANRDGQPLIFSKALFEIDDGSAVLEKLRSLEVLEEDDAGTFLWLRKGAESDSGIILGTVRLQKRSLNLECNSRERLEEGKTLLREALGASLRYKADTFQDAYKAMKEHPPSPRKTQSQIPREVELQLYDKFMRKHYEKWIDEKIPALGNKSPREAVKKPSGKEKLVDLLKEIENSEEHRKRRGEVSFDTAWLWERLGIRREE